MPVAEIIRAERPEDVPVGAEVVVDHVEHDPEPDPMRRIDEAAKVVGRAVATRRSEEGDAVVTPVSLSREIGDRHELDRRHPEVAKMLETRLDAGERSFRGETADVQLVEHESVAPEAR
jgi:hypothetical protein